MPMVCGVLVLGCVLSPDGCELGPQTIARLQRGLDYAKETGDMLVVAASRSPRHPRQEYPMAWKMAAWLRKNGFIKYSILEAQSFNMRSELQISFLQVELGAVVCDPLHLKRVKILVRRMEGEVFASSLKYITADETSMTTCGRRLEPLKRAFIYLPFWLQDGIVFLLHRTPLRRINVSY